MPRGVVTLAHARGRVGCTQTHTHAFVLISFSQSLSFARTHGKGGIALSGAAGSDEMRRGSGGW